MCLLRYQENIVVFPFKLNKLRQNLLILFDLVGMQENDSLIFESSFWNIANLFVHTHDWYLVDGVVFGLYILFGKE
jgi:hypothetical protein